MNPSSSESIVEVLSSEPDEQRDAADSIRETALDLASFAALNPDAILESTDEAVKIQSPWNDPSLLIEVLPGQTKLIEILNSVMLPPLFSAIYHCESEEIEFIFTVATPDDEYWSRHFDFSHRGTTHSCEYRESSEALLLIAEAFTPLGPSPTGQRNLRMYSDFIRYSKPGKAKTTLGKVKTKGAMQRDLSLASFFETRRPMSFFVGQVPIEDAREPDKLLDLTRHINFYMEYFDRQTPSILIHHIDDLDADKDQDGDNPKQPFPLTIVSSPIDPSLLDLWIAADSADTRLAFLYYYQIVEYADFYFLTDEIKRNVGRIIRRPDIVSSTESCASLIMDELVAFRMPDEQKSRLVIERAVDPIRLWHEISRFKTYFSTSHQFDGGFPIEAMIKADWSEADFLVGWNSKIPMTLQKIRNALVHSRESRASQAISPTRKNSARLMLWLAVIRTIASQVAVYRDL